MWSLIRRNLGSGLVLLAILVLAAYTRLSHLDLVEFKDDEAQVVNLAVLFLEGQHLPLAGIKSSVGLYNPPAFLYLVAIPLLFTRDVALVTGFLGLLNVAAVFLCYQLTRDYFGLRAAQIASLLLATSPIAVLFSRKLQAQDALVPFGSLLLFLLFRLIVGKRNHYLILALATLAFLVQLHLAAVALVPLLVVLLLIYRSRIRLGFLALGLVASVVMLAPFVWWEASHQWPDQRAWWTLPGGPAQYDLEAARYAWQLVADPGYPSLAGASSEKYPAQGGLFLWLSAIEGWIFLAGVLYLIAKAVASAAGRDRLLLLLLWLGVPVLFFTRHTTPIYQHYLLVASPVPFIVIGIVLADLIRAARSPRLGTLAGPLRTAVPLMVAVLLAAAALTQAYSFSAFMNFADTEDTEGGYGLPLKYYVAAVRRAQEVNIAADRVVYVAAHGQLYPAAFQFLARGILKARPLDDRYDLVLPSDTTLPTTYLLTDDSSLVAAFLGSHFPNRLVESVVHPGGRRAFLLYQLQPEDFAVITGLFHSRSLLLTWDNSVQLMGYQVDQRAVAGGEVPLTLYWRIVRPLPAGEYRFFSHLVDDSGHTWGQQDALGYQPTSWEPGEKVISWRKIAVAEKTPQGRYWLSVGMYRLGEPARVPLLGPEGRMPGDALRVGPVKVMSRERTPGLTDTAIGHRLERQLGETILFLGYDLSSEELLPGEALEVTLYWRALLPTYTDYAVFLHLLDPAGQIVSQEDSQPVRGTYPTSLWDPGEMVIDQHSLTVPSPAPAGGYRLVVGMYSLADMQRLAVTDPTGQRLGDSIPLSQ